MPREGGEIAPAFKVWDPANDEEDDAWTPEHADDVYSAAEEFCDQQDNDSTPREQRIHVRDAAGVLHMLDVTVEYRREFTAWDAPDPAKEPAR